MAHGPKPQRRLPLQPLYDYCQPESMSHLARMLNLDTATVFHFRRDGIPIFNADRIACKKLGVHPGFIWKKEWVPS